ncbi:MAG TPA: hypothetical protein VD788_09715, partial [Candidatus Polarisedimenticolaceae bacterium]|nr:hypothetical protein [Candidatus Polarisedimenticolaceae bacterium]
DDAAEAQTRSPLAGGRERQAGLPGQRGDAAGPAPQLKPISSDDPGADPNGGGKQYGGLPIAGVRTLSDEEPFRVYNGQNEYAQWRFTYIDYELQAAGRGAQPGPPSPPGPGTREQTAPRSKAPGRLPTGDRSDR